MKSVGHRTGYIEPKGFDFVIAVNTKYLFPAYPMPWVICFVLLWFVFFIWDTQKEMGIGGSEGAYF